jgi:hypothetical protein
MIQRDAEEELERVRTEGDEGEGKSAGEVDGQLLGGGAMILLELGENVVRFLSLLVGHL